MKTAELAGQSAEVERLCDRNAQRCRYSRRLPPKLNSSAIFPAVVTITVLGGVFACGTIGHVGLSTTIVPWHANGTAWESLPHPLQEGLADYVACLVNPGALEARELEQDAIGNVRVSLEGLGASHAQWRSMTQEQRDGLNRVTLAIISRIGLPHLEDMVRSGAVSATELIEASSIPNN